MQPIPATLEAIRELTRRGDTELAVTLWQMSTAAQRIVPQCVGLSLTTILDELTFTLTATGAVVARLDAVQYLDGGPCVQTLHDSRVRPYPARGSLLEKDWHLFARTTSASGIASTLSLPVLRQERLVAGVNLYASTPDAFDGHHEALAQVCGAHAADAVTNADLAFLTQDSASAAPQEIRDRDQVDQAVAVLADDLDLSPEAAEQRLAEAAGRAGVGAADVARLLLEALADGTPGPL